MQSEKNGYKMKPIKCLVISDTHGNASALLGVIRRFPTVDAIIFLGDGLSDLEAVATKIPESTAILAVKGNCDFGGEYLSRKIYKIDSITLGERKLIFTHGDLYGAKLGMDGLFKLGADMSADAVLFGHTHIPTEIHHDGIAFFNPGSLGKYPSTFGVLTITESGFLFSVLYA